MAGEILHDLEFVELVKAPVASMRSKLVVPVSIVLLAIAVGVAFIAVTTREKRDRDEHGSRVGSPFWIFRPSR